MLSLRCALSHYLLQLSADPRSPVLFRCTSSSNGGGGSGAANGHGGSLDVAGLMPTLFLVKDALLQASASGYQLHSSSLSALWECLPPCIRWPCALPLPACVSL